jgi:hypothetical protein
MLKLETKEDLETLHKNQVQESSTLEYKASPAVDNTDPRKQEIAKDASAMANADGGQIIYGMTEKDHLPNGLDEGFDPKRFDGLWFEQVIQQNVRRQIENLVILQIPLQNGNVAVVVTIPPAQSRAPHQLARDGRYYRRRNFRNDIMEDYEVREAMRRTTTPHLDITPVFVGTGSPKQARLIQSNPGARSDPVQIDFMVANHASQPAEYAVLLVYLDTELQVFHTENLSGSSMELAFDRACRVLSSNLGFPHSPPLFRENPEPAGSLFVCVTEPKSHLKRFALACDIRTAGYAQTKLWWLHQVDQSLFIEESTDPIHTPPRHTG